MSGTIPFIEEEEDIVDIEEKIEAHCAQYS